MGNENHHWDPVQEGKSCAACRQTKGLSDLSPNFYLCEDRREKLKLASMNLRKTLRSECSKTQARIKMGIKPTNKK
jgi:hypothetical protein